MTDKKTIINVKNLYKTFDQKKMILQGISCQIKQGEKIVIIGPSGGGKSTLLRVMCGVFSPDVGEVLYDGMPVYESELVKRGVRLHESEV